jgi:hypothetical protein
MKLWPPSGAAIRTTSQKFSKTLWNLKVYYSVHMSPASVPILSQIGPVHSTSFCPASLRSILISTHLRLGLPSGLFTSWLQHQNPICNPIPLIRATCHHPPRLDYSSYICRRIQFKKHLILQLVVTSFLFDRNILLNTSVLIFSEIK